MTAADRKRVLRAIAGALARVDALWNREELAAVISVCRPALDVRVLAPELLRERIVDAFVEELAGRTSETSFELDAESFETLLDAVRMSST